MDSSRKTSYGGGKVKKALVRGGRGGCKGEKRLSNEDNKGEKRKKARLDGKGGTVGLRAKAGWSGKVMMSKSMKKRSRRKGNGEELAMGSCFSRWEKGGKKKSTGWGGAGRVREHGGGKGHAGRTPNHKTHRGGSPNGTIKVSGGLGKL